MYNIHSDLFNNWTTLLDVKGQLFCSFINRQTSYLLKKILMRTKNYKVYVCILLMSIS